MFIGTDAGINNTGLYNTGIGYESMKANTSGYRNTALGATALTSNTEGTVIQLSVTIVWLIILMVTTIQQWEMRHCIKTLMQPIILLSVVNPYTTIPVEAQIQQ